MLPFLVQLFVGRRYIVEAKASQDLPDTEAAAWQVIYDLIDMLGVDGMSSDDSGDETRDEKRWPATVHRMDWRSRELQDILVFIDSHRGKRTALGGYTPGNQPHHRKRFNGARSSKRLAIAGLPRNFYDSAWLDLLDETDLKLLGCGPAVELPVLSD